MRHRLVFSAALTACAGFLAALVLGGQTEKARPVAFYVAPHGNDSWLGRTAERPLATLQRARDAVRALKARGLTTPVEVVVRGGTYNLSEPLVLTPEDSGTATCPVTWRAQEGERVIIRGGRKITGWKPWRNGIYQADLKAQGLKGVSFHQLFYRAATSSDSFSTREVLARYPNFDPQHPRTGGNLYVAQKAAKPREQLIYGDGDIPWDLWKDTSQAEVVSTYNRGWQFAITPVLHVDPKTRTITVRRVRGEFIKLNRYFIQNMLEALDSAGEWYLDRKQSILYFYPPDGSPDKGEVIAPILDNIIEVRGTVPYPYAWLNTAYKGPREECPMPENAPPLKPVEHLVFQGLDFECARQDALRITGAQDCQVVRCRATNVGNIGINLGGVTTSFEEEGNPRATPATGHPGGAGGGGQILLLNDPAVHCRVAGCDVWSSGSEGIMLFGTGNTAENNHVYDIGLYAKDAPCINLLGERNVARRNTLHDSPRCAIFIKGANNVAELNDVHHSVLETSDMGGIRMVQRNAWLKGNIIRYNKVMDTPGYGFRWQEGTHYESPFFTWGIYLDDYTCRTTIFGNIVARTGRGGVMLHGGGDNLVENNMVVNAGTYQIEFAPMNPSLGDFQHVYRGNRVERNVLVSTEEGASPYRLVSRTEDLPEIAGNLVWFGKQEPFVMVEGLMAVKGWGAWLQRGIDKGSVLGDPHFENAKADDFRLRPDSPAWKLGFQRIPVEQIGCFKSPERASWPIQPNYDRFREKPVLYQTPGYTPGANSARAIHFIGTARDDFESDPAGARPRLGDVSAPKPSQIVVTDEIAASGKHCLKFVDAPGLPQNWLPRIYYPLSFSGGVVVFSADFRIDGKEPATFYIDPRQYGSGAGKEYISGPMLTIESTGDLRAGNQTVTRVPFDQWFTIRVRMRLGPNAPKQSDLTVTARGGAPRHFKVANVSAQFSRLERVVISSLATERTVFYLDNLSIAPEGQ